MEQWIRQTFRVIEDGWVREDGTTEPAFEFDARLTSLSWFVERFGSVPVPPTASALKAADPDNATGFHTWFERWAAQGIVQQ